MGNAVSTPESMKNIPSTLNDDEYLQMIYDGIIYCIQKRNISNQLSGSFKQNFTAEAFAMEAIGLGAFKNINKQHTGYFYVTLNNPLTEPIPTTTDASILSWFIKGFAFERGIKLENATFELKKLKASSFGKNNIKKRFKKQLKNNLLKRLRMDLKNVLRSF
jgi:hypothetical protein